MVTTDKYKTNLSERWPFTFVEDLLMASRSTKTQRPPKSFNLIDAVSRWRSFPCPNVLSALVRPICRGHAPAAKHKIINSEAIDSL